MTERLNSNAVAYDGAEFTPAGDFTIQASILSGSPAVVDVQGRVDQAAPWVSLAAINGSIQLPILRFARCPFARLRLSGNDKGEIIKAWSGE